jgi:hypothetical protein
MWGRRCSYLVQNAWELGRTDLVISIVSISISSIVSQVEKAVSPWWRLLYYWGVQFHEVLERLGWNSCLLCNQDRGFLEYALRTMEGSEFVARLVCAGGKDCILHLPAFCTLPLIASCPKTWSAYEIRSQFSFFAVFLAEASNCSPLGRNVIRYWKCQASRENCVVLR